MLGRLIAKGRCVRGSTVVSPIVPIVLAGLLAFVAPSAQADSAEDMAAYTTPSTVANTSRPAQLSCPNARFRKHIAVTDALIGQPPPDISYLGRALSNRLIAHLQAVMTVRVKRLAATRSIGPQPAVDAFDRFGTPYFIRLSASNLALTGSNSRFSFWGPSYDPRGGSLTVSIIDGSNAERLNRFELTAAPVDAGRYQPAVDARSTAFWNSGYGRSLDRMLERAALRIRAAIGCQPMVGTVTAVEGDQLTIDLGQRDGVKPGDSLLVIQRGQPDATLANPTALTHHDLSLGFGKVRYVGMESAQLSLHGPQPAVVGDLIWTGERAVPNDDGH